MKITSSAKTLKEFIRVNNYKIKNILVKYKGIK